MVQKLVLAEKALEFLFGDENDDITLSVDTCCTNIGVDDSDVCLVAFLLCRDLKAISPIFTSGTRFSAKLTILPSTYGLIIMKVLSGL